MHLLKQFGANADAENNGVWFDYPQYPNKDKTIPGFLVGRYSRLNKRFRKVSTELAEEHREEIEKKTLADEQDDKLGLEIFIDGALFGWRNVQPNDDGVELEYSREAAIKLLGTDAPHLLDDLRGKANRAANFRVKDLEISAKN